jgi:hypothetical protein
MPSGGVLVLCAALATVMYVGDKVVHLKPIQKANHEICRVATGFQKCKTAKRLETK